MKLVNARKHLLFLLIIFSWNTLSAQDVLTLEQCIRIAKDNNKNLHIDRNAMAIGEEKEKEVRAGLNPKVTAVADYKYFTDLPHQLMPMSTFNPTAPAGQFKEAQFGVPHNLNGSLQLAIPLLNPQLKGAIENTKTATKLLQLQYDKTEEKVLYDLTTLYYNAQLAMNQLEFIDSNLVNTQKLLQNMQLLKEHSLAKGSDVNKVKLQADQLTTRRQAVSNNIDQILNALKLTMGVDLAENITVDSHIRFDKEFVYSEGIITDLQIINTKNQLLNNELRILNKTSTTPSISLIASYGVSGFGYDKKPNDFLKFYPVGFAGVQLSYPLFDGMVSRKKVSKKKIEIRNNELQASLIADKNKMEVENALRTRVVAQSTLTDTKAQIELAASIYEQTIIQQRHGTATLTDVLLADNSLREAQQNYLTAAIDYLRSDLELKRLTGNIK